MSALAHSLRSAFLASEKIVTIEIATSDLETLKAANYSLCFAKKVGDNDYNVVWHSSTKYLVTNSFSWTPTYQLFGSNFFKDQVKVEAQTNVVNIGLKEKCVLSKAGVLGAPNSSDYPNSIILINEYGSIHPGVKQLSTSSMTGETTSSPIYLAVKPIVLGETELTPKEKVLVWFQQDIETSTMFSSSRSQSIELDLTNTSTQKRLYQNQQWSKPLAH